MELIIQVPHVRLEFIAQVVHQYQYHVQLGFIALLYLSSLPNVPMGFIVTMKGGLHRGHVRRAHLPTLQNHSSVKFVQLVLTNH
jgi:hypothetical protein